MLAFSTKTRIALADLGKALQGGFQFCRLVLPKLQLFAGFLDDLLGRALDEFGVGETAAKAVQVFLKLFQGLGKTRFFLGDVDDALKRERARQSP